VPISASDAERALRGLGFEVRTSAEEIEAVPPFWRGDVTIPEDVVEEAARIVGYDRIESALPAIVESTVTSDAYRLESRIAHGLAAAGYREAVTFALQPAEHRAGASRKCGRRVSRSPSSRFAIRCQKISATCASRSCPALLGACREECG
jgi:phenylalanyl-tRNA synthetase beta subunit